MTREETFASVKARQGSVAFVLLDRPASPISLQQWPAAKEALAPGNAMESIYETGSEGYFFFGTRITRISAFLTGLKGKKSPAICPAP